MSKKDTIGREVQKTLELLDHPDSLPPNPYFFSRVQARLEEQRRTQNRFFAILRPVMVSAMLLLNIGTAAWYLGGSAQDNTTSAKQTLVQSLAGDLNMDNTEISHSLFK